MAKHGCCKPCKHQAQGNQFSNLLPGHLRAHLEDMMVKISMNSLTPSHLCVLPPLVPPDLHWRLGLTSSVPHCCFFLAGRPRALGQDQRTPWASLDMQTADAITSQPWSSLLSLPDFTPVKAVASKIFPRDCTHLAGVLLEMGNYCIHKNPPKWEV